MTVRELLMHLSSQSPLTVTTQNSKGISLFQASDAVFYEGLGPVPVQDRCSVGNRVLGPFWTTLGTPFQEQYHRLGNIFREKVLTFPHR